MQDLTPIGWAEAVAKLVIGALPLAWLPIAASSAIATTSPTLGPTPIVTQVANGSAVGLIASVAVVEPELRGAGR